MEGHGPSETRRRFRVRRPSRPDRSNYRSGRARWNVGELANYHVEIGGPEYRLAPRWKGEWQRFTRKHIGRKDRLCLAAEIDGIAVGFLLAAILQRPKVFEHRRYGHIYDVFVEAGRRNRGAGQALVGAAMDWFRARGVDRVELYTHAMNAPGRRFWSKMGFETTVHIMDRRV